MQLGSNFNSPCYLRVSVNLWLATFENCSTTEAQRHRAKHREDPRIRRRPKSRKVETRAIAVLDCR